MFFFVIIAGCLVHGVGSYNFIDFLQWPHDCNLTITTLLITLTEIFNLKPLPSKLYIQMDNCVRENKNKYVMAFLLYLVEIGIFTEVRLKTCKAHDVMCTWFYHIVD